MTNQMHRTFIENPLSHVEITMSLHQTLSIDRRTAFGHKCSSIFEWAVRKTDALLKRHFQIFEYTGEKDCILRMALAKSGIEITLADGTHIQADETVGELHFWNEHMPPMAADGPNLNWALDFRRRLVSSLEDLAGFVERNRDYSGIRAFRGELFFGSRCKVLQMSKSVKRCGFEIVSRVCWKGWRSFFACFWEIAYNMALVWVFNPASLKDKKLSELKRCQLWISRQVLLDKYLGKKSRDTEMNDLSTKSA